MNTTVQAERKAMPGAGKRPLGELLRSGSAYLWRQGVANPRLVCELLVARLLKCPRLEVQLKLEQPLGPARAAALGRGLRRIAAGEPPQYVLGEWDFRELTLKTDRRALIPRPETEQLVALVLQERRVWDSPAPLLVDVGTGSGCIALSLAQERRQARLVATDSSAVALELARENAERCGLSARVSFQHEAGCGSFLAGSVDAIVSNPPYIPSAMIPTLARQIRLHEPHTALDGGADGLACVGAIVRDAALVLRAHGMIFLEIGSEQGAATREILERHGFAEVTLRADLTGRTRFAQARLAE